MRQARGGGEKFGLRRTTVRTLKLRTSDKFGLRTSSDQSELFAPLARKLRTGPDWEVRTSDWSPNFRPAEEKTSDRIGLGSSDFGPESELLKFGLGKFGLGKFGQVRTSSDFGLQSELLHREELRTGSDCGVFIVFQSLLGISGVLMQTSDWAEKFGLRTGKFGLAIEKFGLRTGKVRALDPVRPFARPR